MTRPRRTNARIFPPRAADRVRVLHVNSGNLFGGIETFLLTLARQRGLCSDMDPSFALCFEGRLAVELSATGVPLTLLGPARASRPWSVWRVRRRLDEVLRAQPCDVVVTHGCWNHAIAAPVARSAGIPLVFWGHAIQGGRHWLERWARRFPPDLVIANSQATQTAVTANLYPRVRSEVIYLPVTPATHSARPESRNVVRAALATPADAVVTITACRLDPYKGHALLLDALARVPQHLNWRCWIAGGAQSCAERAYLASLQTDAVRRGISDRVQFVGQRSDVGDLLAAADIHCQPNVGPEPFGIAFIEALYAGLPVVTTRLGGAMEIIDDHCGMFVRPADPAALADGLAGLIYDAATRRRLGAAGPARATQLCAPARQMQRIGQALKAVGDG